MSVDLNRAAMLESNSPRFESLIAQTAAQELLGAAQLKDCRATTTFTTRTCWQDGLTV